MAPYYGCQILRPRKDHEDVESPRFFEDLMTAIGAEPVDFRLKLRCCGGALLITNREAALSLVRNLLENAVQSGAAIIATACPLCQVNLECYQKQVNSEFGTNLNVPVLYFTQLVGLALGVPRRQAGHRVGARQRHAGARQRGERRRRTLTRRDDRRKPTADPLKPEKASQ